MPWAEYRRTLLPMTDLTSLQLAGDGGETWWGDLSVLDALGVGLFQTRDGSEYHLVQVGENIPDCERKIASRAATGPFLWETPIEARRVVFITSELSFHLVEELSYREVREITLGETDPFIYWQAGKLLALTQLWEAEWSDVVAELQTLQQRGFSNQDIHDLLFHTEDWSARNGVEAGMPRNILWRMYGLKAVIESGFRQ